MEFWALITTGHATPYWWYLTSLPCSLITAEIILSMTPIYENWNQPFKSRNYPHTILHICILEHWLFFNNVISQKYIPKQNVIASLPYSIAKGQCLGSYQLWHQGETIHVFSFTRKLAESVKFTLLLHNVCGKTEMKQVIFTYLIWERMSIIKTGTDKLDKFDTNLHWTTLLHT